MFRTKVFYKMVILFIINFKVQHKQICYLSGVRGGHCIMLYVEGTTSVTPTLLRLISSFDESDGRFVHILDSIIHYLI